jgi:hypothetical protein
LLLIIKTHTRDNLRKGVLNKKKLGLDDLGSSQAIQIAKDVKIRRVIIMQACSE